MMHAKLLSEFFERDIDKLIEELGLFQDEKLIWVLKPGILNSSGTLCLHLAGNLLHFIGATLGNTGYIRERDKEFALRDVPRSELLKQLNEAKAIVLSTLAKFDDSDLGKNFPLEKHGKTVSIHHMLIHLLCHLGYHLGQVNYHRRLVG